MASRARERHEWMNTQEQLDQDSEARDRMAGESPAMSRASGPLAAVSGVPKRLNKSFTGENRKTHPGTLAAVFTLIGVGFLTYIALRRSN